MKNRFYTRYVKDLAWSDPDSTLTHQLILTQLLIQRWFWVAINRKPDDSSKQNLHPYVLFCKLPVSTHHYMSRLQRFLCQSNPYNKIFLLHEIVQIHIGILLPMVWSKIFLVLHNLRNKFVLLEFAIAYSFAKSSWSLFLKTVILHFFIYAILP